MKPGFRAHKKPTRAQREKRAEEKHDLLAQLGMTDLELKYIQTSTTNRVMLFRRLYDAYSNSHHRPSQLAVIDAFREVRTEINWRR